MNSYDTICHEHLEYYAMRQIKWLTDRVGFKIADVQMNRTNGGSFQVTAVKTSSPVPEDTGRVKQILAEERATGMDTVLPYRAFKDRVARHRDDLLAFLRTVERRGQRLIGYGASTKGNVILQYCGLTAQQIPCIAEVNEDKYGCFTPRTCIPIVSELEARARRPSHYLVLPWHFRDSVVPRERTFLEQGGKLVFPLPVIDIIGDLRSAAAA